MHKELNSVKGGNVQMQAKWVELGATPSWELPNRDNAAILSSSDAGPDATAHAKKATQRGGVKTTALAGSVFKDKDRKKGQHDGYKAFMENELGYSKDFPETSNICYGAYCGASPELIETMTWTNLEENLYNALQDLPMLTELCVLALYGQLVSAQYLTTVRADPKANALFFGPFHEKVKSHLQIPIKNSDLVLGDDATLQDCTLDNHLWEWPEVFYTVHAMKKELHHLREIFVSFLEGALETWERFTAEFKLVVELQMPRTLKRRHEFTVAMIDEQLTWHPEIQNNTAIPKNLKKLGKKHEKQLFLVGVIREFLAQRNGEMEDACLDVEDVKMMGDEGDECV
ncbi:hypothetical protein L218DRAFT_1002611 [Marasmius fiardii PR-910]|nr:hypothetical protein L218DRAFT_1002611 [Marasmius fiardii PR-910]